MADNNSSGFMITDITGARKMNLQLMVCEKRLEMAVRFGGRSDSRALACLRSYGFTGRTMKQGIVWARETREALRKEHNLGG